MPDMPKKDACQLLDADHLAVKHLFVEYARLAFGAPETSREPRMQLARRICDELTVHAAIEEEIFYPALREADPEAAPLVKEGIAEHQAVKDLVAQIRTRRDADAQMDELVSRLACAVEHHVKEERDEMFPKARAAGSLDLVALGARLEDRQRQLQAAVPA